MKLPLLRKILLLTPKNRGLVSRFLSDRKLRLKVVKEFQARGIGDGIDPDDVEKWLAIIMKYLPLFIQIILMFI